MRRWYNRGKSIYQGGEEEDGRDHPARPPSRTKRHQLVAIITIALCAVICGADTWVDVEEFGHAKRAWLETFLDLPNGIPSHETFGRVFARLDPEQGHRVFFLVGASDQRRLAPEASRH